jgi:hypothetical protein
MSCRLVPSENYLPQRKAEFLLSTATSASDDLRALRGVQSLGRDPESIPHRSPKPSTTL